MAIATLNPLVVEQKSDQRKELPPSNFPKEYLHLVGTDLSQNVLSRLQQQYPDTSQTREIAFTHGGQRRSIVCLSIEQEPAKTTLQKRATALEIKAFREKSCAHILGFSRGSITVWTPALWNLYVIQEGEILRPT